MGEDLFKEFREHSVAEFFKKNKHMLGFSGKIRSLTTVIHEYVTNALDACEEAGILPDIFVSLESLGPEHYRVTVRDNGPGMPPDIAAKALGKLLAGTKFHRMLQTRGQQGIGAAGVTIFAQMTTGKPVHVKTSTGDGKIWEMDIYVDVKKNEPIVKNKRSYEGRWRGVEVSAEFKGVQYNKGKYSVYEYLKRTALANPHAEITFVEPDGTKNVFVRTSFTPITVRKEAKLHPSAVTVDDLLTLAHYVTRARTIAGMLQNELSSMGKKSVEELRKRVDVDLSMNPKKLEWRDAEKIVKALREMKFRAPPMDVLIPIGAERIRNSLKEHLKPDFVTVSDRKPRVYSGGIPFLVEAAIAYGVEGNGSEVYRFANRTPLLFDSGGCAITKAVNSIDWKRYGVENYETAPMVVFVNISSVHVPYLTAGKQAIAEIPEVYTEIRNAIMEAARDLQRYTNRIKRLREIEQKRRVLERYVPEVAWAISKILGVDRGEVEGVLRRLVEEKFEVEG